MAFCTVEFVLGQTGEVDPTASSAYKKSGVIMTFMEDVHKRNTRQGTVLLADMSNSQGVVPYLWGTT